MSALNSLDSLRIKTKLEEGIFAGLPWFFQLWARDELISLKPFFSLDKGISKNVLMRYFFEFKEGILHSKFRENSVSASDAVGWLYFRTSQAIDKLFNKNEIKKITQVLSENVGYLIQRNTRDGFAVCNERETWMDSLNRDGALIELQALRLFMYKFLFKLTKDKKYQELETWLRDKVREKFWNGKYLSDGLNDKIIRPNLFIAAYIYPELLSKKEWSKCFETVLPKLFLDFGGLSTVDKTSKLFTPNHTGEEAISYHNGDSWFWVNNLAALVMGRINKTKFKKYIEKILNASTKEIIYSGISGCGAELSSASSLKSEGCLNQAWSNAMFIELVEELF
ncbi:amylo-alpha-1,6-glucosidase [Nanoarchaeota archaeon]